MAQIRVIFKILTSSPQDPLYNLPLAYVEWFSKPQDTPEVSSLMYTTSRMKYSDGTRRGDIIELSTVARPVQLVPKFGRLADRAFNMNNSMEIGERYLVNSFRDKESYQAIY